MRDDGLVLCWGNNGSGQLGTNTNSGTSNPNPVPTLVAGLPPLVP
ncbi:MAG: RCC1 domain-containing protein [Polyangiaceae bacterium]|nr:RCC1 domain-containing protein [Polyangiaceae bacterium]